MATEVVAARSVTRAGRVRRLARCRRHHMQVQLRASDPAQLPSVARYRQLERSASFASATWVAEHLLGLAFGATRSGRCACGSHQRKPSHQPVGSRHGEDPRGRRRASSSSRWLPSAYWARWPASGGSPSNPGANRRTKPQPLSGSAFGGGALGYGFDEPGSCSLSAPRTTAAASSSNGVASALAITTLAPRSQRQWDETGRRVDAEAGTDAEQYVGVLDGQLGPGEIDHRELLAEADGGGLENAAQFAPSNVVSQCGSFSPARTRSMTRGGRAGPAAHAHDVAHWCRGSRPRGEGRFRQLVEPVDVLGDEQGEPPVTLELDQGAVPAFAVPPMRRVEAHLPRPAPHSGRSCRRPTWRGARPRVLVHTPCGPRKSGMPESWRCRAGEDHHPSGQCEDAARPFESPICGCGHVPVLPRPMAVRGAVVATLRRCAKAPRPMGPPSWGASSCSRPLPPRGVSASPPAPSSAGAVGQVTGVLVSLHLVRLDDLRGARRPAGGCGARLLSPDLTPTERAVLAHDAEPLARHRR